MKAFLLIFIVPCLLSCGRRLENTVTTIRYVLSFIQTIKNNISAMNNLHSSALTIALTNGRRVMSSVRKVRHVQSTALVITLIALNHVPTKPLVRPVALVAQTTSVNVTRATFQARQSARDITLIDMILAS